MTVGWSCGARRRVAGNVSDRGLGVRVLVSARGHMVPHLARTPDRRKVRDTNQVQGGTRVRGCMNESGAALVQPECEML